MALSVQKLWRTKICQNPLPAFSRRKKKREKVPMAEGVRGPLKKNKKQIWSDFYYEDF